MTLRSDCVEGDMLRLAAHHGPIPFLAARSYRLTVDSVVGRALVERQPIHIHDLLSVVETEFPGCQTFMHKQVLARYWSRR